MATVTADTEVLGESAWQERLDRLSGYSFFATPSWGRVLSGAGLGYQHQAFEFDAGGQRALLPLVFRKDIVGRLIFQSGAFGTYGGLIPLDGRGEMSWPSLGAAAARRLLGMSGFGILIAYPGPRQHVPLPAVFDHYTAYVIDLRSQLTDGEAVTVTGMRRKTRQYIHKAERDGVEVKPEVSIAAFEAYYGLLVASARRWGRANPGKHWTVFESIQHNSEPGSVLLWLARVHGQPAAGLLCFYGKGEVFAWSAALDEQYVGTRANYLLHWRAIADAATRGFETFNLGANERLEGVRWFKEGFGAKASTYPAYVVATMPYSAAVLGFQGLRRIQNALRSIRA